MLPPPRLPAIPRSEFALAPPLAPLGTLVLGWSIRTARAGIPRWDAAIFRSVNDLPDAIAPVVWLPMQAGALAAPLVSGAAIAVRRDRRAGLRVAATGAGAWVAAKALKRIVARGRPGEHDPATVLRIGSADHGLGYPSGHAAVSATLAFATAGSVPRLALGALAATVGVTRIYVGAHYPLDVIGGWALGVLVAEAYRMAERAVLSDRSN